MRRFAALAAILMGFALTTPVAAFAGDWEVSYEKDGVTVSKKDMPDTKLVAFKGETVYDVDIHMVMGVLMDNEHRTEWVDRLYTNHIIERESPFDYVLYQAFELPAMFADRDYVYHGVATRNADTGVVLLKMNSIEHAKAPETVGVRAQLINSQYILTPMDGGKTRIEVEILTDPKGWMPAWLTNMVQKDWPVETLNGIRGQFGKDHAKPHDLPGEAEEKAAAEAAKKAEEEAKAAEEAAEGEDGEAAEGEEGAEGAEAKDEAAEGDAKEAAPEKTDEASPAEKEEAAD